MARDQCSPLRERSAHERAAIRVVIADQEPRTREYLASLLRAQPEVDLLAPCATASELRSVICEHAPDVAIIGLPELASVADDWVRIVIEVRRRRPDIGVVVLSADVGRDVVRAVLHNGTGGLGYLLKHDPNSRPHLTAAIEAVTAGGTLLASAIIVALIDT